MLEVSDKVYYDTNEKQILVGRKLERFLENLINEEYELIDKNIKIFDSIEDLNHYRDETGDPLFKKNDLLMQEFECSRAEYSSLVRNLKII